MSILNTGTTTLSSTLNTRNLAFFQDGTLSLTSATGGSYANYVGLTGNDFGTITISNTSGTNTFASIADPGYALHALNLTGSGGSTVVTGNMDVTNATINTGASLSIGGTATGSVTFTGNGTLDMTGNNKTLTGSVVTTGGGTAGFGRVQVDGSGVTLSGQIGSSSSNKLNTLLVNNTGTTTASDIVNAATVNFAQDGTLKLTNASGSNSNFGTVTTSGNGAGTFVVSSPSSVMTIVNGSVGSSGHALAGISIANQGRLLVCGDATANNMRFTSSGNDSGLLQVDGNVTGNVTFTSTSGGTLYIGANNVALNGNVVTTGCGTAGCGMVGTLGTGITLSGLIGSSATDKLNSLVIWATATAVAQQAVNANTLMFMNNGIFTLDSTTAGSNISQVDAGTDNSNTLNVSNTSGANTFGTIGAVSHSLMAFNVNGNGGTAEVDGAMYAVNTTVGAGATLAAGASNTITGNVINNGTLNLGANTVTIVGNISGTNGALATTVGNAAAGHIVNTTNTTNATFSGSLTITPTISGGTTINQNDKIVLIKENAAATAVDPSSIATVASSGLVRWSLLTGVSGTDIYGVTYGVKDLVLKASRFNPSEIVGLNNGVVPVVDNLNGYTGTNANVQNLQAAVQNLTTVSEINKAGAQLAPQVNDGSRSATLEAVRTIMNTLMAHIDQQRMAQAVASEKGISSGEVLAGGSFWGQGFGSVVNASPRDGVNGYNSKTGGAAFGGDVRVLKDVRVGGLFSYANTAVDEKGDRIGDGMKINSYVGTLYGTYAGSPWYLDANMTFGYHDYKSTRVVDFSGAANQTAKGTFGGKQFGASAEFGYPVKISEVIVTPFTSLSYNYLAQDGYTETGAPGANLSVDKRHTYSLRSGFGAKVAAKVGSTDNWAFTPNARAVWLHEFNPNAPSATASYAGGTTFITPGQKLAQEAGVFGVGLEAKSVDGMTFSAKYDFELRNQFVGNNLMLQVRQEF